VGIGGRCYLSLLQVLEINYNVLGRCKIHTGYEPGQPRYKPLCEPRATTVRKLGGQVTTPTKTESRRIRMKWLAQISKELPERYYVGIDIGYREHVAAGIALSTFMQGEERWKKAKAIHFASSQSGFEQLRKYLDGFSSDHRRF